MFLGCEVLSTVTRLVFTRPISLQACRSTCSTLSIPSAPMRSRNLTSVLASRIASFCRVSNPQKHCQ